MEVTRSIVLLGRRCERQKLHHCQVGGCFSIWKSVNTPSHNSNPEMASTEDSWSVAVFRSGSLRPDDRNPLSGFDKRSTDDLSSSPETSRCGCVA